MVNLKEFSLTSDSGERRLYISPVLLQSKVMPSLLPPVRAFVYENLIEEEYLAHLGEVKIEISEFLERKELIIKHDQDFEKAYLGYLTAYPDEDKCWRWEGEPKHLSEDEVEKLEAFLNNS